MIGEIFERKVDDRGRVVVSNFLEGKKVYIVDLGNGYFVTEYKDLAETVSKNAIKAYKEIFALLVESYGLTAEEVKKFVEEEIGREVSSGH